jgi:hypothetical protein
MSTPSDYKFEEKKTTINVKQKPEHFADALAIY